MEHAVNGAAAAPPQANPIRRRPHALPWRDRRGRFSWLKAITLACCLTPGLFTAFWLASGQLGARPVKSAELYTGLWTLRFLMITLAITPARTVIDWPQLPILRRMVGVTAACYAAVHFSLYIVEQNFRLGAVAHSIVAHAYLTIGFVALLGLIALAATSTDAAVRRMGKAWKRLHRGVYAIGVLGLLHYFMQSKANVGECVAIAGLFFWLMMWRLLPRRWGGAVAILPALALAASALAAGAEFGWYALRTHTIPWRVLIANEHLTLFRPAHWVLISGSAILLLALLRRAWRGIRAHRGRWLPILAMVRE